ncbi:MAG: hydrogenase formation protein HypD [Candidatus Cloacimonas sp. 4484_209]|nr:MAG: hydrogenase formation protein HypD [Candidatus Cloacimonas sp. 4484_209]
MKYIDEFRNRKFCEALSKKIREEVYGEKRMTLMEVCGTHTMAIARYGLKNLLPENIRLLSGPGCPVCVTPNPDIDKAIGFCRLKNIIITTFGDMMRVPGSSSSLQREKADGADVRIVYSPNDAIKIAIANPEKRVIFLGVGFETTAPTVAASIKDAREEGLKNYFVISMHKVMPPALKALVEGEEVKVDGFLLPGHVTTITGTEVYNFIPRDYGIACVVAGFEPVDILQAALMLVRQIKNKKPLVENQYTRTVTKEGNPYAKKLLNDIFKQTDAEWRGIGIIPKSGLCIREEFADFDAEKTFELKIEESKEHPDCICGEILKGVKEPIDCPLFDTICTPENPVGACMVSSEGTCSAYYKYRSYDIDEDNRG